MVKNVHDHLVKKGTKLPYSAPDPLSTDYRPKIDVMPELGEADALYYQCLIGVLRYVGCLKEVIDRQKVVLDD